MGESSWRSSSCRCAGLLAVGTGEGVAAGRPCSASPPTADSAPGPAGGLQGQQAAFRAVKWEESKAPRARPHGHPVGTQANAGMSPVMRHPTKDSMYVLRGVWSGTWESGRWLSAFSLSPPEAAGPPGTLCKRVRGRGRVGSALRCESVRQPAGPVNPGVPALKTTACVQVSVMRGTS